MHTSLASTSTINAVLGDASFLHTFGVPPPPYTDERLRISTHLAYVEQLLRAANVEYLASEQQQKRAFLLDKLHEYWQRGRFPKNTAFPHERRPCFIDDKGSICAVGYLVEQDSGRAAAERINAQYQYEYVPQMDAPFVQKWVRQSGLSVEECAKIQPAYGHQPSGYIVPGNKVNIDKVKKILIIHKDTFVAEFVLGFMLKVIGYSICIAENEVVGLGKAIDLQPDLIICHTLAPEFDKFEAFKKTCYENLPYTSLISVGAKGDYYEVSTCLGVGPQMWLPIHKEELYGIILDWEVKAFNLRDTRPFEE